MTLLTINGRGVGNPTPFFLVLTLEQLNQTLMKLFPSLFRKVRQTYTDWDIANLKIYGAIAGLLIGAYFPDFIIRIQVPLLIVFSILLLRYLYLLFFAKAKQ